MKRLICLICFLALLLSGCSVTGDWIKEPVTFYYVHENYQKDMKQVIESELREASGHRDDLTYLLALYSMGPSSDKLKSPFPHNVQIMPIERTSDSIVLSLSENAQILTDAQFTLASACLALTCMDLTNAQQISVECAERKISINKDNLLLYADHVQEP